ncbi:MAG: hypothetical protein ACTSR8_05875 [Promethearchaeota archaeon]
MSGKYLTIPINIYEGIVEIKGSKKINPLHPFILELAVKENKLESIINSFSLDQRIIQEAIVDLMYKEMVYVDLKNSYIYVSPEIENFIDRGRLEEYLGDEYIDTISLKWAQDVVSGAIMMVDDIIDYYRTPLDLIKEKYDPNKQVQLNRRDYIKIQDIGPQTLIKVAKIKLREFINEGDVFDYVNRIHGLRLVDSRTIYLPLKELKFHENTHLVPISTTIPSQVLEFWTKSITDIDAYTISDLSPADEEFLIHYSWNSLLKKWNLIMSLIGTSLQKNLKKTTKKQILQRIFQKLEFEALKKYIPLMFELGTRVADIKVSLNNGGKIFKKLKESLESAKNLVIIGSAFVNELSIEAIYPLLEVLISKGVKIILIWGLLGNPIENLKKKYPIFNEENISFITSETRFHSKFLSIDRSHAWITSCNLLSYLYNANSPSEAICELKEGKIIGEILEYARSKLNPNREELKWIDSLAEMEDEKSEDILKKEEKIKSFREIIEELKDKCQILIDKTSDKSILSDFHDSFEKGKQILKNLRDFNTAYLVQNLEHRKILRAVLLNAKNSVRLGTDRINRQAISSVIISALNDAFKRNISVQVRWGREKPSSINKDELINIQKIINNIKLETSNRIEISDLPSNSHSKFLTMDNDLTVITSFNLLAFAGNGLADDEITDELGVVISSLNQTREIIKSFPEPKSIPKIKKNTPSLKQKDSKTKRKKNKRYI